jgi:lipopolysaccharide export LptBFGC system permease protein LptF
MKRKIAFLIVILFFILISHSMAYLKERKASIIIDDFGGVEEK